jgi:hypothetical protein
MRVVSRSFFGGDTSGRSAAGVPTSTSFPATARRCGRLPAGRALRSAVVDRRAARGAGGDRSVGAVVLSVRQVLEAVADLGEASLQLVCWELSVHEREARPAFERAIADGLLVGCGVDELHGEVMYALTDAGRSWLEGAP